MSESVPIPDRDYSILTPMQLRKLKQRAQPPEKNNALAEELEQTRTKHEKTMAIVSGWKNTIARNRMERQTRLQKEKEAEEQRKLQIDEEEITKAEKASCTRRSKEKGVRSTSRS